MKYFLGFYQNGEYKPIDLGQILPKNEECDILNIFKFTTSFKSAADITSYLIDKRKLNQAVSLSYLCKKSDGKYEVIYNGRNLYTKEFAYMFDKDTLLKYLQDNCLNKDLYKEIYIMYLKKLNCFTYLKQFIEDKIKNPYFISAKFSELLDYKLSSAVYDEIKNIVNICNKTILNGESIHDLILDLEYNNLFYEFFLYLDQSLDDQITIFNHLKGYLPVSKNNKLNYIETIFGAQESIKRKIGFNVKCEEEVENLRNLISNYLNIVMYDNKKGKIKSRDFVDLGMLCANIEIYKNVLEKRKTIVPKKKNTPIKEDDDYHQMHISEIPEFFYSNKGRRNG